jgi:hypothetical protein
MRKDPIVAEIRKLRAEHAEKYGHDLDRICEALRDRQAKSQRKVVTGGKRGQVRFLLSFPHAQTPPSPS